MLNDERLSDEMADLLYISVENCVKGGIAPRSHKYEHASKSAYSLHA